MSLNTSCTLNIAGNNSNDIYTVSVPSNLLGFCRYDFSRFMAECSRLCRECTQSGEYPLDRILPIRNSLSGCHRYVENNIRTVFDKVVVDCWIEYICRHGEITTAALWNSLIDADDPFQNAIFQRLTEYRTHKAINQWINLLKIQEYAKKKVDFVFGCKVNSPEEAAVRLNFFDLMFSVAANEQGYSLENIGSVHFCKPGRTVGAPFVYSGVSKEIVKNLFKDVSFADSQPYISREEGVMSDWEAMDAFAVIKNHLPEYNDSVAKTIQKSLTRIPDNVFMPSSFKAMIDLEIDSIVNMGGYLQRCAKCGEYYLKNSSYTSDYCDTVRRDGSTCREMMEADAPEPLSEKEIALFNEKAESLYRRMAEKVNFEISQRDFTEWSGNFDVIRNNVISGRATDSDFDDFVEYSEQLANQKMSRAKQSVLAAVQEEMIRPDGTRAQVKPYQFARIDRKELERQGMLKPADSEEKLPPISEGKKAAEKLTPPVAKIIRGANPTSYHEIPVQAPSQSGSEAVIPIKSDVFVGENFSAPAQKHDADSKATASAREAQQEILRMAERERMRRMNENIQAAEDDQKEQISAEKTPIQDSASQPFPRIQEESKPHLPNLEDFPAAENKQEERRNESISGTKHQPPRIKLPEFEEDKKDSDHFVTLIDGKEKKERYEEAHSDYSDSNDERYLKESIEKEDHDRSFEEARKISENIPTIDLAENPKTTPQTRAARVAGAYQSVAQMPKAEKRHEEEEAEDTAADDFAKILSSIERNDGFDDDNLPLDPNGVPLSHKTKHVMDALMKNTGVSPSLIYGRRQAAEKNVIIDEDYLDKNKRRRGSEN